MKIIITESQYNALFEKNSKLIYKMWNDGMNFYDISEYTVKTSCTLSKVDMLIVF
jgi:hypothetical protein